MYYFIYWGDTLELFPGRIRGLAGVIGLGFSKSLRMQYAKIIEKQNETEIARLFITSFRNLLRMTILL